MPKSKEETLLRRLLSRPFLAGFFLFHTCCEIFSSPTRSFKLLGRQRYGNQGQSSCYYSLDQYSEISLQPDAGVSLTRQADMNTHIFNHYGITNYSYCADYAKK